MKRALLIAAFVGAVLGLPVPARACSDFILRPGESPADTSVVSCRTLDFEYNLYYFAEAVPRGIEISSDDPSGYRKYGKKWTNAFGYVGVSALWPMMSNKNRYFEGMNEQGLTASLLWLDRSDGHFQDAAEGAENVSIQSVIAWVLGSFQTVAEVTNAVPKVQVWQQSLNFGIFTVALDLYLVVHDADGNSAVIQWYDKQVHVNGPDVVNTYRLTANDPTYPEQIQILTNFAALGRANGMKIPAGDTLATNQLVLPGDSSSPSRFQRLYKLVHSAENSYDPFKGLWPREYPDFWRVQQANAIMSRVEEVYGETLHYDADTDLWPSFHTVFTVIRDHTHKKIYFRDVYNNQLRVMDLSQVDWSVRFKRYAWFYLDPDPCDGSYYLDYANDVSDRLDGPRVRYEGSGADATVTYDQTILPQTNDLGRMGVMFVFCRSPDGQLLSWNGTNWITCADMTNEVLQPCYSGVLARQYFTNILDHAAVTNWAGRRVYAGAGLSQNEMLVNGKYQLVQVVSDPMSPWLEPVTNMPVEIGSTGGLRQLSWQGYDGWQFRVEASSNLPEWEVVGATNGSFTPMSWPLNPDAENRLFYRLSAVTN